MCFIVIATMVINDWKITVVIVAVVVKSWINQVFTVATTNQLDPIG